MNLPGKLRGSTVGDLLGGLHRARASGVLELLETNGRLHRVHLLEGGVTSVELDRASPTLGEVLRSEGAVDEASLRRSVLRAIASHRLHGDVLVRELHVSPEVVSRALRRQIRMRLAALDELSDAQIGFRVAQRPPRGALVDAPLAAPEFLHGRRRARDARGVPGTRFARTGGGASTPPGGGADAARDEVPAAGSLAPAARRAACAVLGVAPGTGVDGVRAAYKDLVRTLHPDLHPSASADERRVLGRRFAEVTAAYRALAS